MKILIISDTHGALSNLRKVLEKTGDIFDYCFHLGDSEGQSDDIEELVGVPLHIVRGNCDMFSALEDNLGIKVGAHSCLLTHGHLFNAKRDMRGLIMGAKEIGADYVFFGHTHTALIQKEDGVVLANPGSLTFPRRERPSYIIADVDEEGEIHLSLEYL